MFGFGKPITEKEISDGVGTTGAFRYGVAGMQGWRDSMEDTVITLPDFDKKREIALFGVFDGHGGDAVARIVQKKLPQMLSASPAYQKGNFQEAFTKTFLGLDVFLNSAAGRQKVRKFNLGGQPEFMGCTAVVALLQRGANPRLLVANTGDSRCLLVSGSGNAVAVSEDHTPSLERERKRIVKAGGYVDNDGRVDGNLNLSRAIGDLFYKKNSKLKPEQQKISCLPEFKDIKLTHKHRYLILGCDGIYERDSNQQIADFLLEQISQSSRPRYPLLSEACASYLDKNVSKHPVKTQGLGCDNMSLILVDLENAIPRQSAIVALDKIIQKNGRAEQLKRKRQRTPPTSIRQNSPSQRRRRLLLKTTKALQKSC